MDNNKKKNNKVNMPKFNLNWLYAFIIMSLAFMLFTGNGNTDSNIETNYTNLETYIKKGYAKSIVVNKGDGTVVLKIKPEYNDKVAKADTKLKKGKTITVTTQFPSVDKISEFISQQTDDGTFTGAVTYEDNNNFLLGLFNSILPIIILIVIWLLIFRQMGNRGGGGGSSVFSVGKSKAKIFEKGSGLHVTFKDVAGQEGAKEEVQEIVDFLKNPKRYTSLGGKIPKGALLIGPPGTGKTLLAKAVAGEADVPFFSMSGSDFVEMFVGVGASRVRDLFRQAKEKAPCIIFIDEIDAVGRARGKNASLGGNDERENTLNQLLTEMDGFGTNSGVIILAATNRADILDNALLRAGRFDRQIHVDLPDLQERKEIFEVHIRPIKIGDNVDIEFLSRQTPGFSGADIANVCNESALIAARKNKKSVEKQDFLDAVDRIIGGLEKKTRVMTQREKRTIAIHEAGHASISWLLEHANPLVKVTIVPRGQALGAAWYLPEERTITTKEEMLDEICATLGGRAAEELFTGHISSGALNDLETVTKRAFGMIAYLGMGEKLPNLCYYNNQQDQFNKPYSERTAEEIDKEIGHLIAEQYERAKKILSENKEGHNKLAQQLIEKEVVFAKDLEDIFGKRPWTSRSDELLAENEKIRIQLKKEKEEKEKEEATTISDNNSKNVSSTLDVPSDTEESESTEKNESDTQAKDVESAQDTNKESADSKEEKE